MTYNHKESLVNQVSEQIKKYIENGTWSVGTKLPSEKELSVIFEVGRNTIREAVKKNENIGLIKIYKGKGSFVATNDSFSHTFEEKLKNHSINEILEVRYLLEEKGIELAVKNRTSDDLINIKNCLDNRLLFLERETVSKNEFINNEFNFHLAIIESSHNNLLVSLYNSILKSIKDSILLSIYNKENFSAEVDIHKNIYNAILEKNNVKAGFEIKKHRQMHENYIDNFREM